MKVDEFLSNRDPGDETKEPVFEHVTSLTPSGIECLYSWAPKRLYRVRDINIADSERTPLTDWVDVPSVTTVLGILEKPALPWWGMKVGVEGVAELFCRDALNVNMLGGLERKVDGQEDETRPEYIDVDTEDIVRLLTEHKLTVNHVKDKAADRGVNVHNALEAWSVDQSYRGNPDLYEEHERGYVEGLNRFFDDLGEAESVQAEVMVGSLEHGYAGRFDLRCVVPHDVEVNVRLYPKRKPKRDVLPAGTYIMDLKTSKDCFSSHAIQVAAYELASIECGYGSSDYQAVIRVSADGGYEVRRSNAEAEDFLSVLATYNRMQRKAWFS